MRVILLCALLVACEAPVTHTLHAPRQAAPLETRLRARAQVEQVTLELELARRIPLAAEVSVDLELPRGVRLVRGPLHTRLVRNAAARRDALSFVLRGRPELGEALHVLVDARAPGFGYHARLPYRFGQPAPWPAAPALSGPGLRVGKRSYGPSITR